MKAGVVVVEEKFAVEDAFVTVTTVVVVVEGVDFIAVAVDIGNVEFFDTVELVIGGVDVVIVVLGVVVVFVVVVVIVVVVVVDDVILSVVVAVVVLLVVVVVIVDVVAVSGVVVIVVLISLAVVVVVGAVEVGKVVVIVVVCAAIAVVDFVANNIPNVAFTADGVVVFIDGIDLTIGVGSDFVDIAFVVSCDTVVLALISGLFSF